MLTSLTAKLWKDFDFVALKVKNVQKIMSQASQHQCMNGIAKVEEASSFLIAESSSSM